MIKFNVKSSAKTDNIYQLDGRVPVMQALPFGLQHILAMFVSNIIPIYLICGSCVPDKAMQVMLMQHAMIVAGIGTLVQLYPIWRIGSRLPVVMGISFTFLSLSIVVASQFGLGTLIGSVIIGGLVEGVLGLLAKYWIKLITPVVSASVVTAIGFSLLSVGADSFAGGAGAEDFGSSRNWLVAMITLVSCCVIQWKCKGIWRSLSLLLGMVIGYIVALFLGMVDFTLFHDLKIITLPHILPIKPEFNLGAILSFVAIFLVSAAETIGDTTAITNGVLKRTITERELSGSIACDGFMSSVSSLFGCPPITSYSQNIGVLNMTRVINRFAIATGAIILIMAGFFPAVGAALGSIPNPVLGGCSVILFGSIIYTGISMIAACAKDNPVRTSSIVALSLSIGLGFTAVPEVFRQAPEILQTIFANNCVALVFVVACVLDKCVPEKLGQE